ncbi:MAG TPA: hypothetical protein QF753_07310 [Victivallales bacterium]|nr:hypothetical protein [Victivallales bacterium]
MTNISDNFQKLISIKGTTIPKISEELKIPFSNLYRLANQEPIRPRKKQLKKLAYYFDITYEQFIGVNEIEWGSLDGWLDILLMNTNPIPICLWKLDNDNLIYDEKNRNIVVPTCNSTVNSFALEITSNQYEIFPSNTKIICEPNISAEHSSIVIVKNKNDDKLYLRKYLNDPRGDFLKLLDKNFTDFKTYKMESSSKIFAVVIHFQCNLKQV